MNFELTEVQRSTRDTFRKFVDRKVKPRAKEMDESKEFPHSLFCQVGDLGFFGMRYPQDAGGMGMDIVSYSLAVIELARGSLSLAAACTMQSLMATYFLHRHGNKELKEKYFHPALAGEKIGAICMTEPNAGSDLNAITTKARFNGKHYFLSGQKTWVTSAPVADFFTVLARVEGDDGLSIFFVPANAKGVEVGKSIEKLGVRASLTSEVYFDNVRLSTQQIFGGLGGGTKSLREILAEIRVMTGALAIGVATAAYEDAIEYAKTRVQFGRPIGKFQAVRMKLAGMSVKLETSKQMLFRAAWLTDQGLPREKEAAIVKLYASECAAEICDEASRVLASYGYAMDFPFQRYLRDVRFTLIGGGTSEILKINIAKELGL